MATLDLSRPDEVRLVLSGAAENAILATVRRWPHWLRAEVDRDPADTSQIAAVTLVAQRDHEATVREILRRSFGLTFPEDGGSRELATPEPPPRRRNVGSRRV
jgi:hypothetical protein